MGSGGYSGYSGKEKDYSIGSWGCFSGNGEIQLKDKALKK